MNRLSNKLNIIGAAALSLTSCTTPLSGSAGGSGATGTGAEGAGAAGAGSASATGGSGSGSLNCDPMTCPAPTLECLKATCRDDECTIEPVELGTPIGEQTTNDCLVIACDGEGGEIELEDDTDLPGNIGECIAEGCLLGVPVFPLEPSGARCGAGDQCNAAGDCVDCVNDGGCGAQNDQCVENVCRDCDFAAGNDAGCSGVNDQCSASNTCVDCDATGGCPAGEQCNTPTSTCVDCVNDAGCSGATPRCRITTNVCVQCLTNADCSGGTPTCTAFVCVM